MMEARDYYYTCERLTLAPIGTRVCETHVLHMSDTGGTPMTQHTLRWRRRKEKASLKRGLTGDDNGTAVSISPTLAHAGVCAGVGQTRMSHVSEKHPLPHFPDLDKGPAIPAPVSLAVWVYVGVSV